jgi:hypothetical protein
MFDYSSLLKQFHKKILYVGVRQKYNLNQSLEGKAQIKASWADLTSLLLVSNLQSEIFEHIMKGKHFQIAWNMG